MKHLLIALAAYLVVSHFLRTNGRSAPIDRHPKLQPQSADIRSSADIMSSTGMDAPPSGPALDGEVNAADLKRCCEKIMRNGQSVYFLTDHNGKMKLQVRGIYAHGASLFFQLRLYNRSPLDYDVDSIRFFIAGSDRGKSPPPGTKALKPLYIYDSTEAVPGYSKATSIFVLPRFTLQYGRQLLIDVQEKNGGRHLQVKAGNLILERARLI
jgi:hypothetical protein